MKSNEAEQFDDPVLKSAVKQAYAHESAPAALRQRVASILNDTASATGPAGAGAGGPLPMHRRNPLYGLAAAAILLLAVGIAISQYLGLIDLNGPDNTSLSANALPVTLVEDMVVTHENCAKLPDHHLLEGVAETDLAAIRQSFQADLGRPVLVAELGDGWTFQGAGSCMVGKRRTAHLLFTRGNQAMSIFSLPPVSYQVQGDGNYETSSGGHPIAGFATRRGLYCLVATDPTSAMTPHDVALVRDRIRGELPPTAVPATNGSAGGGCPSHMLGMR